MASFRYEHGIKAKDKITGMKGTITGRADYISGCNQYLLQPEMKKGEVTHPSGTWFDEQRLEILSGKKITLTNRANGAAGEAPIK